MRQSVGGWVVLAAIAASCAGCGGYNPHAIGNMPPVVHQVAVMSTPAGITIATAMRQVTGNQAAVGTGQVPGTYTWGPVVGNRNAYYVNFEVPINLAGIAQALGYKPKSYVSSTIEGEDWVYIHPLANTAFNKLYYDPSTNWALFAFRLTATGQVLDRSWDAVDVNS